ncbi:Similar to U4/U6 small nuclear ribonucleoprotein Prp31; acc. no. Q8CCF0 [Pyronema omphalodes CBS 100304]|uniref:Similar to U4/U6 small nuclear ribonucleoprotein Prp31 acc. no. Q8CCF0 n=1 Tax=Pyronema omphalodes (strain CBS 100304) TaxID=1076935 RepID=U4LIM3_PYROM|nr:Similar to U4/U6 small nuclear ribonucleoprotein Prp31; acc. no. Q8CCF0 [Pyronema omphalodes CBS 100304]
MAESSLAADLLADFNDSDEEELEENGTSISNDLLSDQPNSRQSRSRDLMMDLDGDEEGDDDDEDEEMTGTVLPQDKDDLSIDDDEETRKLKVESMNFGAMNDVRSVAKLMKVLEPVLEEISHYQSLPAASAQGNVEDNPEYKLLVQSNAHAVSIDNEIILVHKFIRDHYAIRFPELETLVGNPLDYAKCVTIIGNNLNIKDLEEQNGRKLRQVLDGPTLMTVTVEATTSAGRELSEEELTTVLRAAEMTQALDAAKRTITAYVESRMSIFAPNTSAIVGSQTAAQLINFAGGLRGLAATPACNIAALGSKRKTQTGLATNIGIRQQGYLYHSPVIRQIPSDLKKQAMRIVAAKVVLASRVDFSHSSPDGRHGEVLKEQVLEKLEKLTIPPPNKGPRALPAPDDKPSRKRGGRRARKAKEATAMTDIRKAQNRMAFGKQEEETGYGISDSTKGLGMIGQQQSGRIRALQVDQRTRAKLGKNNAGWAGIATPAGGAQSMFRGSTSQNSAPGLAALGGRNQLAASAGGASGTASSLAFTPFQGIELIDPKIMMERKRKAAAEDERYFSGGTFTQVGSGSMLPPPKKQDVGRGKGGLMMPPPVPKKQ